MAHPQIFHKYTTPSTAVAVLESTTLRWSSPLIFNDCQEFAFIPQFSPTIAEGMQAQPEAFASFLYDGVPVQED